MEPRDTVWAIASGRPGCVRAILDASAIADPTRIRPGTVLTVPEAACPVARSRTARAASADEETAVSPVRSDPSARVDRATHAGPPRIPASLSLAEDHLRAARFEEALAAAEDAIERADAGNGTPAGATVRAHVIAATVHVALSDRSAARRSLARALELEPALSLDASRVSPKVRAVLSEERAEREIRIAQSTGR